MGRAADLEKPSWPALMPIETARAYLGDLSVATFRLVTASRGVLPVDLGLRVARWRKTDLDMMIDKLAARGAELTPDALMQPDPADLALERVKKRAAQ